MNGDFKILKILTSGINLTTSKKIHHYHMGFIRDKSIQY
jgi:hypothetical protein